jgi:hypothetical protein
VVEAISWAIKKDLSVDGFQLPNGENVKIFQYADDTTIIVHSEHTLRSLFSIFK